jgi:hypothetical protein
MNYIYSEDYLAHHGIKGMKWGIRKYQNSDGSLTAAGMKKYDKMAKKDAKKYTLAKMYYGEGAGNRRKLINNTVNQRAKDSKFYKKQFDKYVSETDMEKTVKKAKKQRNAKDAYNAISGNGAAIAGITVGAIVTTAAVLHATGLDKKMINKGKEWAHVAKNLIF